MASYNLNSNISALAGSSSGKVFITKYAVPSHINSKALYNSRIISSYEGDDKMQEYIVMGNGDTYLLTSGGSGMWNEYNLEIDDLKAQLEQMSYNLDTLNRHVITSTSSELTSEITEIKTLLDSTIIKTNRLSQTADGLSSEISEIRKTAEGYYTELSTKIEQSASGAGISGTNTVPYIGANGNWYAWKYDSDSDSWVAYDTGIRAHGYDGEDGHSPYINDDGYWVFWDPDAEDGAGAWVTTNIQAKGEKGEKGDKGDDGITPTVSIVDDTWYINGESTGVSATGSTGANSTPEYRFQFTKASSVVKYNKETSTDIQTINIAYKIIKFLGGTYKYISDLSSEGLSVTHTLMNAGTAMTATVDADDSTLFTVSSEIKYTEDNYSDSDDSIYIRSTLSSTAGTVYDSHLTQTVINPSLSFYVNNELQQIESNVSKTEATVTEHGTTLSEYNTRITQNATDIKSIADNYVTKTNLDGTLTNYYTKTESNQSATGIVQTALMSYVSTDDLGNKLNDYVTQSVFNQTYNEIWLGVNSYVDGVKENLYDTGIDLQSGIISAYSSNFKIYDNNGTEMGSITSDGTIKGVFNGDIYANKFTAGDESVAAISMSGNTVDFYGNGQLGAYFFWDSTNNGMNLAVYTGPVTQWKILNFTYLTVPTAANLPVTSTSKKLYMPGSSLSVTDNIYMYNETATDGTVTYYFTTDHTVPSHEEDNKKLNGTYYALISEGTGTGGRGVLVKCDDNYVVDNYYKIYYPMTFSEGVADNDAYYNYLKPRKGLSEPIQDDLILSTASTLSVSDESPVSYIAYAGMYSAAASTGYMIFSSTDLRPVTSIDTVSSLSPQNICELYNHTTVGKSNRPLVTESVSDYPNLYSIKALDKQITTGNIYNATVLTLGSSAGSTPAKFLKGNGPTGIYVTKWNDIKQSNPSVDQPNYNGKVDGDGDWYVSYNSSYIISYALHIL